MTKAELIEAIVAKTEGSKKDAEANFKAIFEVISEAMAKGEKVSIPGFGTFETRKRDARKGRNPQTKKEITIPACTAPAFKAGKALKEAVNK